LVGTKRIVLRITASLIASAGEALDGVPVLLEGWATCFSRLPDGRRQILSFLLPGDLVSVNAIFSNRLSFFVEAVTAVRCSAYDRGELTDKLTVDPLVLRALIRSFLARRVC
jgi:CRP-like cAMP-binding protein